MFVSILIVPIDSKTIELTTRRLNRKVRIYTNIQCDLQKDSFISMFSTLDF